MQKSPQKNSPLMVENAWEQIMFIIIEKSDMTPLAIFIMLMQRRKSFLSNVLKLTSFFQDLGLSLFMTLIPLILFPGTFLAFDVPSRFAFYSLYVYCTVYSVRQLSLAAQNTGRYLK